MRGRIVENGEPRLLGKIIYGESIGETRHGDELILFLAGAPNLQDLLKRSIGETVFETLDAELALELTGRRALTLGVAKCGSAEDYVTRDLLTDILSDTEEHIDFLETQIKLTHTLRQQNYLQSAAGELSDAS